MQKILVIQLTVKLTGKLGYENAKSDYYLHLSMPRYRSLHALFSVQFVSSVSRPRLSSDSVFPSSPHDLGQIQLVSEFGFSLALVPIMRSLCSFSLKS